MMQIEVSCGTTNRLVPLAIPNDYEARCVLEQRLIVAVEASKKMGRVITGSILKKFASSGAIARDEATHSSLQEKSVAAP